LHAHGSCRHQFQRRAGTLGLRYCRRRALISWGPARPFPAEEGSMIDLTGRTAIITGGANGIGFEAAKTFAKAGTRLVLVDISADAGSNAVNELSSVGHEAIFVQADVSN